MFTVLENPISPLEKNQIGHQYRKDFISRPLILFSKQKSATLDLLWRADMTLWKQPASHGCGLACLLPYMSREAPACSQKPKARTVSTHYSCVNICSREHVWNTSTTNFLAGGEMKRRINAQIKRFRRRADPWLCCLCQRNTWMAFSSLPLPPVLLPPSFANKKHSKSLALLARRIKLLFATWCCLT